MIARRFHVLLFVPTLLLGQGAAQNKSVPEDMLFRFFFLHVSSSESSAKAKGNSESTTKRALKDKAGLTDAEVSLVKEVALSCNDAYDAKMRIGGAEVLQLASQNKQKATPPPAVAARINALERERAKVITDCLDSLKRGMGASRYAKLDTYVRQTEGPKIRYVQPTDPDPNLKPPQRTASPIGNDPNQGGLK